MSITVKIGLSASGTNTGPFDLYSNVDSYASPFESGLSKSSLLSGYTSTLVPDLATIIRVKSTGACTNYADFPIQGMTTTTTTSTTTTTTTVASYGVGCFGYDTSNCNSACTDYNGCIS